jgi:hypothetical protein
MAIRSCRVTITDREGIARTVEVTASSLHEAVAMGLKAMRGNQWVAGVPDGFAALKVSVPPFGGGDPSNLCSPSAAYRHGARSTYAT